MRDELLEYYERELTYLRRLGAEFGKRYPRVAAGLQLEPTRSEDPHVERLLEGFAFLAARVHLKIDDELPELTQALLSAVYPEYARPVPSMSLVQFHLDPDQGKLTTGYAIPRESLLYSRPVAGVQCRFRTSYDTTLWPIQVTEAAWIAPHQLDPPVRGTDAVAALRIMLRSAPDVSFARLGMNSLRMYLNAEPNVAAALYELLCNNSVRILIRRPGKGEQAVINLAPTALRPVGFGPDEGVLPLPRRSHVGFRLLSEYFTFPEKFFFLDLTGPEQLRTAGFGDAAEVVILISRFERSERRALLEGAVNADTIRLGCSPVINLFRHTSEPVLLTQRRHEYQLVPDARRRGSVSVYSVEEVVAVAASQADPVHFEPLYSNRHGAASSGERHYWHATRRPRGWRGDEASDVFLSFVDSRATASHPDLDAVTARLLCYNADLPGRLQIGDPGGDFEMPGGGPVRKISALVNPSPMIPAPANSELLWRLVSLLSLNFVSLVDSGPETLQELLRLHNLRESPAADKQIQAIVGLSHAPAYARISGEHGLAFARGQRISIELDEEQFAGGGAYLFASVLEHFFGVYTSLNSFNVLHARTRQRKELLKECEPRSGWKALV
jgi:type VI secretion system protein ImpG